MRYEKRAAEQKLKAKMKKRRATAAARGMAAEDVQDSCIFETFIDSDHVQVDSEIVEKDKEEVLAAHSEPAHVRTQSLTLSDSQIIPIRNTSIFQDYRFSHISKVGRGSYLENDEDRILPQQIDDPSLQDLFEKHASPPTVVQEEDLPETASTLSPA